MTLPSGAVLAAVVAVAAGAPASIELLPDGSAIGWEERSFAGHTRYRSGVRGGVPALRAEARASASGLYLEREVPLAQWPVLRWRWQVETPLAVDGERDRGGDDFAARVYVIAADPVFFWRTRGICYVWASSAAAGESWPNPFTQRVIVVVLRSGDAGAGHWAEERRDVAADFRRYFGQAPERVDAVALMTDADQTGGSAAAWYADLRFEAR